MLNQTTVSWFLVLTATAVVLKRLLPGAAGTGACGSCGKCGSQDSAQPESHPLVTLNLPQDR